VTVRGQDNVKGEGSCLLEESNGRRRSVLFQRRGTVKEPAYKEKKILAQENKNYKHYRIRSADVLLKEIVADMRLLNRVQQRCVYVRAKGEEYCRAPRQTDTSHNST